MNSDNHKQLMHESWNIKTESGKMFSPISRVGDRAGDPNFIQIMDMIMMRGNKS